MNACWSRCPPADSLQKAFTEDFRSHCSVHFRSSGIFTRAKLYLESYDGKKDGTVSKTVDQRAYTSKDGLRSWDGDDTDQHEWKRLHSEGVCIKNGSQIHRILEILSRVPQDTRFMT